MTLQLSFFLDASADEHVTFEIMALIKKKPPKSSRKLRKKLYVLLIIKLFKPNEKIRKKIMGDFD